ncbi:MAG: transglutaminase domain-containing protein, partial [Nitrospirae bacterium]|nr:transglutaminase domain-containing protein [Nitrospirota bacterium]
VSFFLLSSVIFLLISLLFPQPSFSEGIQEAWSGIYIKGKKSGYSIIAIRQIDNGYAISENVEMIFKAMNSYQKIKTAANINTNKDFLMKSFTYQLQSEAANLTVEGKLINSNLHIKTSSPSNKQEITLPLKSYPFLSANIIPYLFKKGFKENTRYRLSIFDPSTLSIDEMAVELVEKEKKKIGNRAEDIYHLKGTYKGMAMHTWIDKNGRTIREESPMGMTIIQETKEMALREPKEGELIDIIDVTAITPDIGIKEPSKVKYLKARLSGIVLKEFNMDDERQKLSGDTIEIKSENINNIKAENLPVNKKGIEVYLEPTLFIQSNDKEIISFAKDIIGNEKSSLHAARLINEWVYKNIEKRPVVSIPNARDVLKMRAGDCNEHTTLFVAIARAAKIPARINVGIVYLDNRFFYHAWPEVYVGRWVALDPTLNQFPADATHIRFVTGELDKQMEIMKIINRLKIEIIKYGD